MRKLLVLIVGAIGCATEPTSNGSASIVGRVLHATGDPWVATTVEVVCSAGTDTARVTTDSTGSFGVSLVFVGAVRDDQTAPTSCRFAAPSLAAPQAAVTQSILLYRSLQPSQRVTLHEGST